MSVSLGVFAAVVIPSAFLTGIAAACSSFTAWNIMVPLLFTALGLPVFQSLFVSVMLDVCNGLALTLIYGWHGRVDFRYGVAFGSVTSGIAILIALSLSDFIENNEQILQSAAAFIPVLIGIQFLIKGILAYRAKKKLDAQQAAIDASEEDLLLNNGAVVRPSFNDRSTLRKTKKLDLLGGHGYVFVTTSVEDSHMLALESDCDETEEAKPLITLANANTLLTASTTARMRPEIVRYDSTYDWVNPDFTKKWTVFFASRFKAEEDLLKKQITNRRTRIAATIAIMAFLGIISGTLYAGSGMFFATIIVNAWGANVRTAAGTGCFIMTMVMLCLSFSFINKPDMEDIRNLYHILLACPFGVIGSIVGAKMALILSDVVVYFFIVAVCMVLFLFIVIQEFVT
eukprot:NODE_558_length_1368_cov_80.441579_g522_i0.p1 GENE.NODE_558_length_1368_cov_80.441579_g522_i0~~NODE_558_length_1368_cov_80.441579_g522_i0.p1  ORF type:complete len:400 (-),score=62.19 NODE_558_length_1368_cov_80.441579_g522_i0:12-1211(-)